MTFQGGETESCETTCFYGKKKKQLTENKQEFKIMTADTQHLTQSAE